MNDRDIRSILQDALEEKIPSADVKLWPAIKASLVARKHQLQQGDKMNATKLHRKPRLVWAGLAIVVLLSVALVTPQGRTFAQSVLQLFVRAPGIAFPLPTFWNLAGESDPSAPTAEPPAPLIDVAEAEAQAGFEVAELPSVPDGLDYLGARLYGKNVSIEYQTPGRDGHLTIMQSQEGFVQSDWDRVPAHAIVPVKIGELDGEFARGTFVVYAGENSATWNPDAPMLRLRWIEGDVWFEMTKYGQANTIEYLDQAGLIELAESLTVKP